MSCRGGHLLSGAASINSQYAKGPKEDLGPVFTFTGEFTGEQSMGKIVTVASQKGGVGKTTTALNLAYNLSRLGDRILLVDVDPQGGMSIATNVKKSTDKGLMDYLTGKSPLKDVISFSRQNKLAVLGVGITDPEDALRLEVLAKKGVVSRFLAQLADYFEYVIVDAPAGLGGLLKALLAGSDGVILTLQCRALALKTLPRMLSLISWLRESENRELRLLGTVITMLHDQPGSLEMQLLEELRSGFPEEMFFTTTIAFDPVFEIASLKSMPVAMVREGGEAAEDYQNLALEFKQRELDSGGKGEADVSDSGLF